jgi:hypothetical protein
MSSNLQKIQVDLLYLASHLEFGKRDPNDDVMIIISRENCIEDLGQIINRACAQGANENEPVNKSEAATLERVKAELEGLLITVNDSTGADYLAWAEKIREIIKIKLSVPLIQQDLYTPCLMVYKPISKLIKSASKNQCIPLPGLGTPSRPQESLKANNPIDDACVLLEKIATVLELGKDPVKGYKDKKELVKNGRIIQPQKTVQAVIAADIKRAASKLLLNSKEYLTLDELCNDAMKMGESMPNGKPLDIELKKLGIKIKDTLVKMRAAQKDAATLSVLRI